MTFTPSVIGIIDNNNTTSDNLSSNAIFTGIWTDIIKYNSLCISVNSDVNSANNGLVIQFAIDNTGSTILETFSTTVNGNTPYISTFQVKTRYYRIVYTNSSSSTTSFNVQSLLKTCVGNNTELNIYSTLNSSNITLTNTNTFTGIYEDVSKYSQISTSFLAIGVGTGTCTYSIYFSSNGVSIDTVFGPYTLAIGTSIQQSYHSFRKYYRIEFTNNSGASVNLAIETRYFQTSSIVQTNLIDDPNTNDSAITAKCILYGQYTSGKYDNVSIMSTTTGLASINVAIQDPVSVFGEINTSILTPVTQLSFIYNIANNQLVKSSSNGSGNITVANRLVSANTGSTANSFALVQSRKTIIYRGGQGSMIRMTAVYSVGVVGTTQLAGVGNFTTNGTIIDGYFFGYNGTVFGILHANSASNSLVLNWIPQSEWNIDNFSGNGGINNPSGASLDPTFGNVYQIKYQYLGYGTIRFYVESPHNGAIVVVHIINYVNTSINTNVSNPNMSISWYATNNSITSNISVSGASAAAFIEGMRIFTGPRFGFSNTKTIATTTNIFALKILTTYPANSLDNFSDIKLANISVSAASGGTITLVLQIILNPTLGGSPSFTNIDSTNSIVSTDISTTTVSGGTVIYNCTFTNNANFFAELSDSNLYVQPGEIIVISVSPSANTVCSCSISWVEDT